MNRSRAEILKDARSALDMLERVQYGSELPGSEKLALAGRVDPSYAIGWAKGALRRALDLPDQPTGDV